MRTGVVLIVHGSYARALLGAAGPVVGALDVSAVEVQPGVSREEIRSRVEQAVAGQDAGGGTLLLVDICGSTPANVCLELQAARPELAVVTGLSLAMLLKLATIDRGLAAQELAVELHRSAQRSVQLGTDLLNKGGGCAR